MSVLSAIAGMLIPSAHAAAIEQLGVMAPGINAMWNDLQTAFPHTGHGSGGFAFVMLMATNIVLQFIAGIAVLMIIYGGIRMISTVADENGHTEAKKIVQYAVVGLILAMLTDAIVQYTLYVVRMGAGG